MKSDERSDRNNERRASDSSGRRRQLKDILGALLRDVVGALLLAALAFGVVRCNLALFGGRDQGDAAAAGAAAPAVCADLQAKPALWSRR